MSQQLHATLARFYFVYYFFVGAFVPYWGVFLVSEKYSATEIGLLMSVFQLSRIFAPNFWGWLADHTAQRVVWIRLTAFLGLLGFVAIFWAHGFFWLFLVMTALSLFTSSIMPLSESLTLAHLAKTRGHYGRIRMWGSMGFIVASIVLGFIIDMHGITSLLWFILMIQIVLVFLSFQLPEVKIEAHHHDHISVWNILKQPPVLALLIGCSLMVSAHGLLYNFYSIYLENYGYSKSMIGMLWSVGVVCEIAIFAWMPKIMKKFTLKSILMLSLLLGVVRFVMIGTVPNQLGLLLIAQCLHAFTFGSFHAASVEVVTHFFNGRHHAKGQAIYNSVAYGVGGAIGGIAGGFAMEIWGGPSTFLMAAAFPLVGCFVMGIGLKLSRPYAGKGMFSE